jgi:hypothetical protein
MHFCIASCSAVHKLTVPVVDLNLLDIDFYDRPMLTNFAIYIYTLHALLAEWSLAPPTPTDEHQ